MNIESFKKAQFIVDTIKQIDIQIHNWRNCHNCKSEYSAVTAHVCIDDNFAVFRDGIIFKLKERKRELESELNSL